MAVDLKSCGQGPYIMAAPIAFMIFAAGTLCALLCSPTWELNNLSALGTSKDFITAVTFGISCFVAGILVATFGLGKMIFERGLDRMSGFFFIIGGFSLLGVGIFDASSLELHNNVTMLFAFAMVMGISLASFSDILQGNKVVFIACILMLVIIIAQWPIFTGALSECVGIALASVWSFIQTAKYQNMGALSSFRRRSAERA